MNADARQKPTVPPAGAVRESVEPAGVPARDIGRHRAAVTSWTNRWGGWLAAAVLWLGSNFVYWLAAYRAGFDFFSVAARSRWDSFAYLTIAADGYEVHQCTEAEWLGAPVLPGTWWCGTAGWFPLYPAVMRAVHAVTGLSLGASGWLIAELAAAGLFALLVVSLRRLPPHGREVGVLAVAATLPAGVYFHAIFPMSLTAALLTVGAALLASKRWLLAGIAFALAAPAYPLSILAVVMAAGTIGAAIWRRELAWRRGVLALVGACGPAAVGLLSVFVLMQVTVGHWDAYQMVQARVSDYSAGHNVFANFIALATTGNPAVRAELLLSLGLIALAWVAIWLGHAAGRLQPIDVGLGVFGLTVFVAPLYVSVLVSQFRSHLLLVPVLLVLRHLPAWSLWALATVSLPVTYVMSRLFFQGLIL